MVGAAIGGAIGGIGAWMTGASGEEIALAAAKGALVGGVAGFTGGAAGFLINAAGKVVLGSGVVASAVSAGAGIAGSAVASDVASKFAGHVMDKGFGGIGEFEYSGKEAATAAATGLATFGLGKAFGFVNSSRTAVTFGQRVTQHVAGATAGSASSVLADAVGQGTEYLMSDDKENWKWNWERTKGAAWTGALTGSLAPFFKTCFAAGTPLLTPTGHKNIEDFRAGDLLLSRDENDPDGPVEAKAVEEVFVRNGRILHLHVGGQIIKTTAEHPFYVQGKGWTDASKLNPGDRLPGHDGRWVVVEEVYDTGDHERVYNLRVADFHTYFVGSADWGFSVWAHNANRVDYSPENLRELGKQTGFDKDRLRAMGLTDSQVTKARWLARKTPTDPLDSASPPLLAKTNQRGQGGDPAHRRTISSLVDKAKAEFPDDIVHQGTSIRRVEGGGGLRRNPDVWVEDAVTGRVRKVYEAVRKEKSTDEWVRRERAKQADYEGARIPHHFEEVR